MPGRRREYERLRDSTSQIIDTKDQTIIFKGYSHSLRRSIALNIFCILFLGIPYLVLRWYPQLKVHLGYKVEELKSCDHVLIKSAGGAVTLSSIVRGSQTYFDYQLHRYVWSPVNQMFEPLNGLCGTLSNLISNTSGLSMQTRESRLALYGLNKIPIEVVPFFNLLFDELIHPFYIFEFFTVVLWTFDEYYYYAGCVFVLSVTSMFSSLIETRKQSRTLRDLVSNAEDRQVSIIDDTGEIIEISSDQLVPGDVVVIPPQGFFMTCDALLITGTCIVNESVLTGESTPVTKTPAQALDEEYDPNSEHSRHTLYCGTQVIQTRFYHHDKVTALVMRTGSSTAKGNLVHSILFPKAVGFEFYRDAVKFVLALFLIALIGCCYSLYIFIRRDASFETTLIRSLDIITIVVPAALPAAMTVGTVYSQRRLKKNGIFCTTPARINVAGKVKLVCFDKTGTLTEEGLSFWGALLSQNGSLSDLYDEPRRLPLTSPFLHAMATCHSLTEIDGNLCGDPLDLSMFLSTDWELEEPGYETSRFDLLAPTVVRPKLRHYNQIKVPGQADITTMKIPFEIGVVRQFPFMSSSQCMSVITRTLGARNMSMFTKGAPEKIQAICQPETKNLNVVLSYYTSSGFRVIAIAYKELPSKFKWTQAQRATREQLETGMKFLGLLLMQNKLKPQSATVINQLQRARIKCLMLTGDSMLTAVSVSRECGLIQPTTPLSQVIITKTKPYAVKLQPLHSSLGHTEMDSSSTLAVDGSTWSQLCTYFPSLVPLVATRGVVFARMSPQQKALVVETLQNLDYVVAMIGDGANDCAALKAANVGISLSSAEASIAAPFTASTSDVTCLPLLIMEGRCALVTSFGVFNFMALYSLAQFCSVMFLYEWGIEMGNMEFLYVDLVITTSLAIVMGRPGPAKSLVQTRPITALASAANVIPLILQGLLIVSIQYISIELLRSQDWYVPVVVPEDEETEVTCWENTTVFIVSTFQYLIIAIIYSKGLPHRERFLKNWLMVIVLLVLGAFNVVLLLAPIDQLSEFFELEKVTEKDIEFRSLLLSLPIFHFIFSIVIENKVASSTWLKWLLHKIRRKKKHKNRYKSIETHILSSRFWDPFNF